MKFPASRIVLPASLAHLTHSVAVLIVACTLLGAVACTPSEASDPAAAARALQKQGSFEATIEPLREALAEAPADAELNYLYGRALVRVGQRSAAHWPLRRAMDDSEWRSEAGLLLAASLLALSNHEAATEVLDPLIAEEPENIDALLLRSNARLVSRMNYEGALADADRVLELDPENVQALTPRTAALLGLERLDEVADALEVLEKKYRDEELDARTASHFCLTRAMFAKEKGDLELAGERLEGCLESSPLVDEVLIAVVDFHDEMGNADRSLAIIREGLERTPEATLYRTALAERLEARGRVAEAEALLREGLEVGGAPEFVRWANLSGHYRRLGNYAAAADAFETSVGHTPSPPPAMLFEFAELLLLAEHYERALEVADQIEVRAMQELIRGRVAYERKDYAQSLEHFSAGLVLWPDHAIGRYLAGRSAEQLGDFDRAIQEFHYAVRSDAEATDARYRLTRIRLAEGDLPGARTEAVQASDRFDPDPQAELALLEEMVKRRSPAPVLNGVLARLSRYPSVAARSLAIASAAAARDGGAGEGARFILKAPGIDLSLVMFADALDALVGYLLAAAQPEAARERVAAALAAHPTSGALLAVEAHRLERIGAPAKAVRRAYERALAANPRAVRAITGLARLDAAVDDARPAVDHYRRAAALEPLDPRHRRNAVALLLEAEDRDAAIDELEALLFDRPTDTAALLQLGDLLLERGAGPDLERALALGERARRFRGGQHAEKLVATARERLAPSS